jgi:hypothetical protein
MEKRTRKKVFLLILSNLIPSHKSLITYKENLLPDFPSFRLLVSCCNVHGALYSIENENGTLKIHKVLDEDCRGMARYKDHLILATHSSGILKLNSLYQVESKNGVVKNDYHGVAIYGEKAYIAETSQNVIGIYELAGLKRIGEIRFPPIGQDVNHINDVFISGNRLFVSMFSMKGDWRNQPVKSGAIWEYSLTDHKPVKVHHRLLSQPHSVLHVQNQLFYCNSAKFEVRKGHQIFFRGLGYTRGLAIFGDLVFIGQSES